MASETAPLNAGSKRNVVQFTYTSTEDERMAGGKVRIAFPAGWTLGDKIKERCPRHKNHNGNRLLSIREHYR